MPEQLEYTPLDSIANVDALFADSINALKFLHASRHYYNLTWPLFTVFEKNFLVAAVLGFINNWINEQITEQIELNPENEEQNLFAEGCRQVLDYVFFFLIINLMLQAFVRIMVVTTYPDLPPDEPDGSPLNAGQTLRITANHLIENLTTSTPVKIICQLVNGYEAVQFALRRKYREELEEYGINTLPLLAGGFTVASFASIDYLVESIFDDPWHSVHGRFLRYAATEMAHLLLLGILSELNRNPQLPFLPDKLTSYLANFPGVQMIQNLFQDEWDFARCLAYQLSHSCSVALQRLMQWGHQELTSATPVTPLPELVAILKAAHATLVNYYVLPSLILNWSALFEDPVLDAWLRSIPYDARERLLRKTILASEHAKATLGCSVVEDLTLDASIKYDLVQMVRGEKKSLCGLPQPVAPLLWFDDLLKKLIHIRTEEIGSEGLYEFSFFASSSSRHKRTVSESALNDELRAGLVPL